MPSSLILTGGATVTKTVSEVISQSGHGFTTGSAVRWDVSSSGQYVLAKADNAVNSEVVGVVGTTTTDTFTLVYSGYINVPSLSLGSAPVYFLSGTTAGELSDVPPSAIGSVVKPVLSRNSNGQGLVVMNYLGTQIGGSSTVAIDEIQPVGTIMPFAGSVIPDTWLECNGSSYGISEYAELYDKILYPSGDKTPMYGYVAKIIGFATNAAVGDILQYKTNASSAWTGTYNTANNAEIVGDVIYYSSSYILVSVRPNYDTTLQKFSFPNIMFGTGARATTITGTGNYRHFNSAGTLRTAAVSVTSTALTHFATPDLRGRFAVGSNPLVTDGPTEVPDDTTYNSTLSAYSQGEQGGSEFIGSVSNVAQWNAASDEIQAVTGSSVVKPPYLVTKYIIKAKPYTKAAIIDGVELPYSSLLVTDLRTRSVGGSDGDLVIKTNTSGDGGLGTERMRITTGGNVGIGTTNPKSVLDVEVPTSGFAHFGRVLGVGGWAGIGFGYKDTINGNSLLYRKSAIVFERTDSNNGVSVGDARGKVHILNRGGISSNATSATLSDARLTIDNTGNVGIGTISPGATLDVNGDIKATKITVGSAILETPTGSAPLFGVRAWGTFTPNSTVSSPPTIHASGNVTSITTNDSYIFSVTLTTGFSNQNWAVVASCVGQTIANVNNTTTVACDVTGNNTFTIKHALANTSTSTAMNTSNTVSFMVIG